MAALDVVTHLLLSSVDLDFEIVIAIGVLWIFDSDLLCLECSLLWCPPAVPSSSSLDVVVVAVVVVVIADTAASCSIFFVTTLRSSAVLPLVGRDRDLANNLLDGVLLLLLPPLSCKPALFSITGILELLVGAGGSGGCALLELSGSFPPPAVTSEVGGNGGSGGIGGGCVTGAGG